MYEIMAFLFENYKETHTTPVAFFLYYLLRQKSVQEAKKKKKKKPKYMSARKFLNCAA